MNLSAELIEGLATEAGFRAETLEKVIRLGEFAADVAQNQQKMQFSKLYVTSARQFPMRNCWN